MTLRAALTALFLIGGIPYLHAQTVAQSDTLRDPQTGIIYHIQSDRRHIVAISPKNDILWTRDCCSSPRQTITTLSMADPNDTYFQSQKLNPSDYLSISWGMAWGLIKKRDGKVIFLGSD